MTPRSVTSTMPIFDEAVYCLEALRLPSHYTEDDEDAHLARSALACGIEDPYHFLYPIEHISSALSTWTVDSDRRSSASLRSSDSRSTSLTSAASRTSSRDHSYVSDRPPLHLSPSVAYNKPLPRLSISDVPPASRTPSVSVLPAASSGAPSVDASSLPSRPSRRRHGAALFALFRKDPSPTTLRSSSPEPTPSASPLATRVPRQHAPLEAVADPAPSKSPARASSKPRARLVRRHPSQSHATGSPRDSGYGDDSNSPLNLRRSSEGTPVAIAPLSAPGKVLPRARHDPINIDAALAREAFKTFHSQQKEQFDWIEVFQTNQRLALSTHHQRALRRLTARHERRRERKKEEHVSELDRFEDKQLTAEHDLRAAQIQETQNMTTALKHMEAYCLGTSARYPEHTHVVTEEDFKKLDRQRLLQQNLPRKLQNAINVLRAKQERETKRKAQGQADELKSMHEEYEKEKATLDSEYAKEVARLEALMDTRRRRLMRRWDLRLEMWRREWEAQNNTVLAIRLEHLPWPTSKIQSVAPISRFSALAQFVQTKS